MSPLLPKSIREELYRLSFISLGYSSPNPPVACVIQDARTGEILSSGSTRQTGGNHAEREAYRILRKRIPNGNLPPHYVYVTLEPCSHFGKTPPCVDLILEEKPEALYYGWKDPNPLVKNNPGLAKLADAGIKVISLPELEEIASVFLFGFMSRIGKERPAFLIKGSLSREGFFSSGEGEREKISSPESDSYLSLLRAKVDAILVGPKTVQIDLPGLDFRPSKEKPVPVEYSELLMEGNLSGFPGLVSLLPKFANDSEILRIHEENVFSYQPLRVFFLSSEDKIPSDFLEKQKRLNREYSLSRVAFFIEENTEYSSRMLGLLSELSDSRVERYSSSSVFDSVSKRLGDWGVNLALIEGGNFLYRNFSPRLSPEEGILKVRSESVSFSKGILPEWKGNFSMEWKARIGSDEWEVWRACSQDS
ncbi:bifunctional diaminohydroxyphosphoribosylaminopyrimidine deaminase/5-amino-6-(5-phosphoribosylamino)uracil reductase [Leptospira wolffii]|uniref:bifunctional diaminohydroxyphosphoribosylaminopyrimidine deaminase/5-amino-6-(5-phosphoribosylamino)uracil reductase RibD n=1 Tax=Leptospira wolffii TaxID=409998 RepID=UPI001082C46A|nr:dihydrofolate reductase family protein [Leptospira wolffii]TGL46655.1 bifunctional diaminohydroxyphosphoribosylaminopyrimidine deaminase/5-amino-6-(5-phosphoribosylamino)uracil reductase [Leptospira wolffii]